MPGTYLELPSTATFPISREIKGQWNQTSSYTFKAERNVGYDLKVQAAGAIWAFPNAVLYDLDGIYLSALQLNEILEGNQL